MQHPCTTRALLAGADAARIPLSQTIGAYSTFASQKSGKTEGNGFGGYSKFYKPQAKGSLQVSSRSPRPSPAEVRSFLSSYTCTQTPLSPNP